MVENRKVSIGTLAFNTTQRVEIGAAASSGDGVSHAFGDLLKFGFGLGHGSVTSGSQQRVTAVGDFGQALERVLKLNCTPRVRT